ncbi:quinate permease [Trichoderma cornu-damae]|uniref:Quinate transporter n=1 Tax=Trichoderma cornu-damae TaxID=654480 RepID=A0A9P8QEL6_9HYPO|nr:quinate permease [Trichoderma cornu-damae]
MQPISRVLRAGESKAASVDYDAILEELGNIDYPDSGENAQPPWIFLYPSVDGGSTPRNQSTKIFWFRRQSLDPRIHFDRNSFQVNWRALAVFKTSFIMTILALKEDRPTPKAVYNWRVYACAATASFAACVIGYDSAFIGTTLALPSFETEFSFAQYSKSRLTLMQQNIVSVYQAGAFFGSLAAYVSSYFLGRRRSLLAFAAIFLIGAGMMLGANGNRGLGLIIGGRVLAGFGVGGCSNMTPIYISELAPPAVRGRLVGLYELGWQIGGLVGFWITYGVNTTMAPSKTQWLIPFAVQLVPGGLLLIGATFIPESPRWLFLKGKREEALKVLCWMRQLDRDDKYIVEEVGFIEEDLERYRREVGAGFWKPFLSLKERRIQWRFLLGALLFIFQNGSGINAINYYSPTVFRSIGVRGTNTGFLTTGVFGVVKTTLTLVWLLVLIDHMGRRKLLMVGAIGGSLSANNWLWNFIIARFTQQMFEAWGYGVYFFFASLMIISVAFVFFCIPETKALPLEAMDRLFKIKPTWKANKILLKELRAGNEEVEQNTRVIDWDNEKDTSAEQVECGTAKV